jgi:hypothetical protein
VDADKPARPPQLFRRVLPSTAYQVESVAPNDSVSDVRSIAGGGERRGDCEEQSGGPGGVCQRSVAGGSPVASARMVSTAAVWGLLFAMAWSQPGRWRRA